MWRRASLSLLRSSLRHRAGAFPHGGASDARALFSSCPFHRTSPLFFSDAGSAPVTKKLEDVMPIATGLEREELEAELQGKQRFETEPPVGPFGTKEAPAVIESYYNKRLVGCPGGEGEDEHDVVWFWLEKDKPHECPVCSQYFTLKVIGEGGDPEGHDDDDDDDEHDHH